MNFIGENIFLKFKIGLSLIDMVKILLMKLSESKSSLSVKSYDENTVENYWNCYIVEKRIVSKPSKPSIFYTFREICRQRGNNFPPNLTSYFSSAWEPIRNPYQATTAACSSHPLKKWLRSSAILHQGGY